MPNRPGEPDLEVYIGGQPLSTIAAWGDAEITHGRNGPIAATWGMALKPKERPYQLVRNAPVTWRSGGRRISFGILDEPDWDAGEFTMIGGARLGEGAEPLTAAGAITSKLNTAIDQAVARGVTRGWYRGGDFGNTDLAGPEGASGVDDPNPGKLNELMDLWATQGSVGGVTRQWRVTGDGLVVPTVEDESTPQLLLLPGTTSIGVSGTEVTDRVFLRYNDSAATRLRTASYPAQTPIGGIERRASIVHLGPMTAARTTTIAEGMYRRAQAGRTGWTNGWELSADQMTTVGGQRPSLALVRAGVTAQAMDQPDPRGASPALNVVLDETTWRVAEGLIQLNPVGLVARTWEQVMAEALARDE